MKVLNWNLSLNLSKCVNAFVYPCVWQIGRHEKKTKSDKQRNPQVLCVSIRTFNLNVKTDKKNKKKTGIGRLRNRQSNIDIELSPWGRACGSYTVVAQPGLTKSRDTVTLFNLLKRDQDHVFSKFSCFKAQISGRGANNIIQEL